MIRIEMTNVRKRFYRGNKAQILGAVGWKKLFSRRDWFLALDQVSFSVTNPGTCLGIIGSNGSGKTTLLRIIAGVTDPTSGTVIINGRVVPLLEASAGMQPDLTGRENIFLNGAVLGMRRREIARKLDSIVHFAGVKDFIDMPLKHYSSGMITRLGFGVASHVEADILLVDETWSMTDISFQEKSFDRLSHLRKKGAVLFLVSHDPNLIRSMADNVLWLEKGRVIRIGPTDEVLNAYLHTTSSKKS